MNAGMDRAIGSWELLGALALAGVVLGVLIGHAFARGWGRRRLRLRMERARAGEQRARQLLRELGYSVLGSQVSSEYGLSLDQEPVSIAVRADYLVERAGVRYVAEVKTGLTAPRIQTSATRRQLLEYRFAFDVDGVLLVDVEAQRVHVVRFPFERRPEPARPVAWAVLALVVAAATLTILVHHFVVSRSGTTARANALHWSASP